MKKGKGFALAELMILIEVIILLLVMLLPALSRARESARRAACINHLKQIMLGIKTYTPDYDDSYPTSATPVVEEIRRPGRIGTWRDEFTAEHLAAFERTGGMDWLVKLGYEEFAYVRV